MRGVVTIREREKPSDDVVELSPDVTVPAKSIVNTERSMQFVERLIVQKMIFDKKHEAGETIFFTASGRDGALENYRIKLSEAVEEGAERQFVLMPPQYLAASQFTNYLVTPFDAVHALENPTQGNLIRVGAGLMVGAALVDWGGKIGAATWDALDNIWN